MLQHRFSGGLVARLSAWRPLAIVACLTTAFNGSPVHARKSLVVSPDGQTVYDTAHDVTWLADANLPVSNQFGLPVCDGSGAEPCVNPGGSMNYEAATAWIAAMNAAHYLGHADWRLPTTPSADTGCGHVGPHGNSFGFGCTASAFGSLYYLELSLTAPDTAVPIPNEPVGPFINFQPYLYWSGSQGGQAGGGAATFSFNTGFQGGNTAPNFLYVLPMIPGQPQISGTWVAVPNTNLQVSDDGKLVYDADTQITWSADANLALSETFGLPYCTDPTTPHKCINQQDGSMTLDAAEEFVTNMNTHLGHGYLRQTAWQLPPVDPTCPNYNCRGTKNPMGNLYYKELNFAVGVPVVPTPNVNVGPFQNLQPYLYWACQGEAFQARCLPGGPAPGFEWSFSFGNGFEGTDILGNSLYVTAYFPGPPTPRPGPQPR